MNETLKREVIHQAIRQIEELYIFADIAKAIAEVLQENYQQGYYTEIVNISDFASAITEDLQFLSKDKHLELSADPNLITDLTF